MCDYRKHTLIFSSTPIGTCINGLSTKLDRSTAVNVRQNFWNSKVSLDGSYPAIVYRHDVITFLQSDSVGDFVNDFMNLSNFIIGKPQQVTLTTTISSDSVNLGLCYLETYNLEEPERLLYTKAGLVLLQFVGNTKPITF